MIIWRIQNSQFKILTEISNLSESNITYLLWSNDGTYLFAANQNGSIYILEFNEFFKTSNTSLNLPNRVTHTSNITSNINIVQDPNSKKRIIPEIITSSNHLNPIPTGISNVLQTSNNLNPVSQIQDCLRCQKQKLDSIETKIVRNKIESFKDLNVVFEWENKVYDNYSLVTLRMKNNQILFSNKLENKLFRHFACNNFFYAVYDTHNNLSIYTLFSTMVKNNIKF